MKEELFDKEPSKQRSYLLVFFFMKNASLHIFYLIPIVHASRSQPNNLSASLSSPKSEEQPKIVQSSLVHSITQPQLSERVQQNPADQPKPTFQAEDSAGLQTANILNLQENTFIAPVLIGPQVNTISNKL